MLVSLVVALVVSSIVTQVAVFSTTIYLHRTRDAQGAVAQPGGRMGVQVRAVDHDRAS